MHHRIYLTRIVTFRIGTKFALSQYDVIAQYRLALLQIVHIHRCDLQNSSFLTTVLS